MVVCARRQALIERTAAQINQQGGSALAIQADVTSESEARVVVEQTVATYGRPHILMNDAGMSGLNEARLPETRAEDWDSLVTINLRSVYCCANYALPQIVKQGGGSIINVAAAFETRQWVNAAYAAAKGGVESLTHKLAREWFQHNIRVNCLSPGSIRRSPVKWPVEQLTVWFTRDKNVTLIMVTDNLRLKAHLVQ